MLMRAALRPVVVQVPCLAARVSPAACPWRLRSRPCVPSPAVGVPSLGHATISETQTETETETETQTSAGLFCSALLCTALHCFVRSSVRCVVT